MKRIALLQYDWPLQSHTVNFAKALASAGYEVDLIFKKCATDLVDMAILGGVPNVRVLDLDRQSRTRPVLLKLLFTKLERLFECVVQRFAFTPLMWLVLLQTRHVFRPTSFDCIIGVEKKGMIWAGLIARRTGTPYFYFSLELYDEEHPYFFNRPGFPALRKAEALHHRKTMATIVQDQQRGACLIRSNALTDAEMVYFPVSVPGEVITEQGDFFRARFTLPNKLPVVLFLGLIDRSRYCLEVAQVARHHSDQFILAFHGYGHTDFIEQLRIEGGTSLIISTDLVAEELLPGVVASASIGLALYRNDCANDRLTAFSSEKVALYCRAGVPFIAFDTESYRSLKARFDCCVLIEEVSGVPGAVREILANYDTYRNNAFRAFTACYRYADNVARAIGRIDALLASR